ncbi:hypothetical protein [Streptomyces sp. NPDC001876]|uniref:hypothetical protein n=1 Tax=Streptomyces sp. NPDC001876 TaxID=3154402 RepID=UPI00332542BA
MVPRLGLAAVDVGKEAVKGFWRSVRPKLGRADGTAVRGSAGVAKFWYDAKAKGPRAATANVKVPVQDTGADLNHDDTKSRVVASQGFAPATRCGTAVATARTETPGTDDPRWKQPSLLSGVHTDHADELGNYFWTMTLSPSPSGSSKSVK